MLARTSQQVYKQGKENKAKAEDKERNPKAGDTFLVAKPSPRRGHSRIIKDFSASFLPFGEKWTKSHLYEKKTVFDILGVVYDCTMSQNLKST